MTDLGALREAVRTIETNLGPITGAALIAGGFMYSGPLHLAEDDGAAAMFHMNVDTVSRGLRALLPGMVARGVLRAYWRTGGIVAAWNDAKAQETRQVVLEEAVAAAKKIVDDQLLADFRRNPEDLSLIHI